MRVSDSMKYRVFQQNIARVNQQLLDVQTQIATGKSINKPSDDPIKYAADVKYDAEMSVLDQISTNMEGLVTLVSMYDTCFTSIGDELTTVQELANTASTMDTDLLTSSSEQIGDIIEFLVDVANTKLGNTYVFGGQQTDSAPFQLNSDYSVTYTVDETEEDPMEISAGASQTIEYGVSGKESFYSSSKIAYASVGNTYTGDIYSTSENFVYVIDSTNNTINANGTTLTLTSGVYSGSGLAEEIESTLGSSYTVAFDSTARTFSISNNTGSDVDFDWSASSSASALGFESVNTTVQSGDIVGSDLDAGSKSFLIQISTSGSTTGSTGRAAYQYSIDGGATWSSRITVSTGGADETAGDIAIDGTNNTFFLNGSAITITNGVYTGSALASEIQTQLGTDYTVSYDTSTRKFSITNNTSASVVFDWSNAGSTAAGVLGFENTDSVISAGASDESDYDAGMFIDGSGVVNTTNNGIKLSFSTETTDSLTTDDTFQIEDLGIFDLLTNLKNAFDAGDTKWISDNTESIEDAMDLITGVASVVAYEGTQAETIIENNETKIANIQDIQSTLVGADTTTLGVELTALTTTYETLLSAMSKTLDVSILDYL
jgi:flagellin-like hook-associated protein FlgL